jgi:RimJ/RimL family protein N-acetyltransferase
MQGFRYLELRPAHIGDAAITLAWRNNKHTRFSRADARCVNVHEHIEWLSKRIEHNTLWIATLIGEPVGQITLDGEDEIGWIIGPLWRRAGIGRAMLELARSKWPSRTKARVIYGNDASMALASSAGYRETHRYRGFVFYERKA